MEDWTPSDDVPLMPRETERFDSLILNPPQEDSIEVDSLAIRSVFRSKDERSTVHFQPDRLIYTYSREGEPVQGEPRPSFAELRRNFDPLFKRLEEFARKYKFENINPDFWEVAYTNAIHRGNLWQTPADWHRVCPALFPIGGPTVTEHEWTTFDGEWFFNMPYKVGRVRVKARKAVVNQSGDIVLLLIIRARGSLDENSGRSWSDGLDLGHQSVLRVFYDIASEAARSEWGYNHERI